MGGCGEPAHNTPEKWEEEFDRNFKYVLSEKDPIYGAENTKNKNAIKIFISHAISVAVVEERRYISSKIVDTLTTVWAPKTEEDKKKL